MKYLFIFSIFLIVFSANLSQLYAQETDQVRAEFCEKNWRQAPDMCSEFIPEGYYEEKASKGELTNEDRIKLDELEASVFGYVECPIGSHQKAVSGGEIICIDNTDPTKTVTPIGGQFGQGGFNFTDFDFSNAVWPIVVGIIIIFIVVAVVKAYVNRYPTMPTEIERGLQNNFRGWDDHKFEKLVADVYNKLGYHVQVTPRGPDQGVDIIAEKRGERKIIQAKCWINKVSNTDVLKTVGAMPMHKADKATVVTTSDFTSSAIDVLNRTPNLELINMTKFREIILKAYRRSK